jgi:hypothetical protein
MNFSVKRQSGTPESSANGCSTHSRRATTPTTSMELTMKRDAIHGSYTASAQCDAIDDS